MMQTNQSPYYEGACRAWGRSRQCSYKLEVCVGGQGNSRVRLRKPLFLRMQWAGRTESFASCPRTGIYPDGNGSVECPRPIVGAYDGGMMSGLRRRDGAWAACAAPTIFAPLPLPPPLPRQSCLPTRPRHPLRHGAPVDGNASPVRKGSPLVDMPRRGESHALCRGVGVALDEHECCACPSIPNGVSRCWLCGRTTRGQPDATVGPGRGLLGNPWPRR